MTEVARQTFNQRVADSNPARLTNIPKAFPWDSVLRLD